MKRTLVGDLKNAIGTVVKIQGWVCTIRDQKKMQFVILRDHTGSVQMTHERSHNEKIERAIAALTPESAVEITGKVARNETVRFGQLEIIPDKLKIHSKAASPLPVNADSQLNHRLDWRFLDLRHPRNRLVFEIQTCAENAMRCFWQENGFIEIHSPKLMRSPSESGAELFRVQYFRTRAYLAQSPQFYKQMAMACGFEKVCEIGPVFRANPSFTSRHDTEFTSIDMEISWIDSHEDVMGLEERWLRYVLQRLRDEFGRRIAEVFGVELRVPSLPFPRITMKEAQNIVKEKKNAVSESDKEGDLDPESERIVANFVYEHYKHEFVFITDYDWEVRPFYHMRYPDRPGTTKSFDLLWKGVEVTTGAQREHRYDLLVQQAREKGLNLKQIRYYLDFFKYGCPPHGGFGFGLTRMLMIMLNIQNVREVTYLYRGPKRLTP